MKINKILKKIIGLIIILLAMPIGMAFFVSETLMRIVGAFGGYYLNEGRNFKDEWKSAFDSDFSFYS